MNALTIPTDLLARYDVSAPRYTSYPPIPYWPEMKAEDLRGWLEAAPDAAAPTLSLYVHIPFCRSRCFYCGCFVIITSKQDQAEHYAETVCREMELTRAAYPHEAPVRQFHLGGGTPTFVSMGSLTAITEQARKLFPFDANAEMSIEVDPRTVNAAQLGELRSLGFNRLSLGVQDFDEAVQRTVNRIQPYALVESLVTAGRAQGYGSINLDLIYGLPLQTESSFGATLDQILQLRPDRLALYNYAHLPEAMPYQRRFDPETLPDRDRKLAIFLLARERLMAGGYVPIGLDHFALPEDELARAQATGTLQRNFMGYTTQAGSDSLAFGISAISDCHGAFWQNEKKLNVYEERVRKGEPPVTRGMRLDADDRIRKAAIAGLFCGGRVDFPALRDRFAFDPREYFAREWDALAPLEADGLIERSGEGVIVTERGQFFLRNIAVVFDAYHRRKTDAPRKFSRTL